MDNHKQNSTFVQTKNTCAQILAQGKEHARELVEAMSLNQKIHLFVTADPRNRMRLISLLDRPKDVVQAVPEEEVYWTIKEIGAKKSLPLLRLSSDDQLHFLCDVEWWQGDTINYKRVLTWLRALTRCGDSKVAQWLRMFDFDLLALTLKNFIRVYKPHDDYIDDYGEAVDSLPLFTFDGIYFIHFFRKESADVIKRILTVLCSLDLSMFRNLMEYIIWGVDAEMEFQTFEGSQNRLSFKGIPDYDEAREVYRYIPKKERARLPQKDPLTKSTVNIQKSFYPIRVCGKPNLFLTQVLEQIDDFALLEDLSMGLAHVANKVVVADHFSMNNHPSFKEKLAKTTGLINIGLEEISGKNVQRACHALHQTWLEHIFQIGWSRVLEFKKSFEPVIESITSTAPDGIELFDFPIRETIIGVQKNPPQYFAGTGAEQHQAYRDFQSNAELDATADRIDMASFLGNLLFVHLGITLPQEMQAVEHYYTEERFTIKSLVMTALANKYVSGQWSARPVDLASFQVFADRIFGPESKSCAPGSHNELIDMVVASIDNPLDEKNMQYLTSFIDACLACLEKEYREATEEGFLDIISFKIIKISHL